MNSIINERKDQVHGRKDSNSKRMYPAQERNDPIKERGETYEREDPFKGDGLMKDLNIIESKTIYLLCCYNYHTSTEYLFKGNAEQCPTCFKEVSGGCSALGKTFHKECFQCSNCQENLENRFFSAEDKPFCETCYKVSKDFST